MLAAHRHFSLRSPAEALSTIGRDGLQRRAGRFASAISND